MKTLKTMKRQISLLMALAIMFTFAGCRNSEVASSTNVGGDLWDDELIYAEDDIVVSDDVINSGSGSKKENGTTSSGSKGNASTTASTVYKRDEEAAKDFLDSVPKELRGSTVKVLTWWDPLPYEQAKIKEFKDKTGITIKWINAGLGNIYTKIASMRGSGQSADLAPILQQDFPSIIMQKYFQPLSVAKLDLNDKMYDIDTMNQFKYDGQYYGAMIKSSTMVTFDVILYNADIYKNTGVETPYSLWQKGEWNWETFKDNCAQLKKQGVKYGVSSDYGGNWLAYTTGADAVKYSNGVLSDNTEDPKVAQGYEFVNELKEIGYMDGSSDRKEWLNGNAGMCLTGNYVMQNGDWLDKNVKFNWGFAPAPSPKGSATYVPSEVKLFGVPVGAKNPKAAGYWLRYWLDSTYETKSAPTWSKNTSGVLEFNSWLWEQNKTYSFHSGVITKGGDYDRTALASDLSNIGSKNVQTQLKSWSDTIKSKIKLIESEK